jgi:hypothetical protein
MTMKYLRTFSACLVSLALHSAAWAQVYETKDAEGNVEFTDAPTDADAEVINLQETNTVDAPPPEQQEDSQPQTVESGPAPVQENNTVIIHDNDNDGYDDGVYGDDLARQRALDGMDRVAPGEVGDPRYEMPREVGDSEGQMPREVGDTPDVSGAHRR